MPKVISFEDKPERLKEVQLAMKETKDKRLFERYQCIYLLLLGRTQKEIARTINRGADTVGSYVQAYRASGLHGLLSKVPTGRPKQLTNEQEAELYQLIVEKTPVDVGFPANMNWTALLIRDWISQHFHVTYSERGVRAILYRLGFSHTRPTYTLAKADPEKQKAFKEEFEGIKKNCINAKLIESYLKMRV